MLPEYEFTGRSINGCKLMRRKIGVYIHVDESKVFDQPQEFAAWHRRGTFPAGEYPVYQYLGGFTPGRSYVLVALTGGKITSASFRSHFGGVAYGSRDPGDDEIGQPFEHSITLNAFGIGQLIADGDKRYVFDPAVESRQIGEYSTGKPMLRAYERGTDNPIGD